MMAIKKSYPENLERKYSSCSFQRVSLPLSLFTSKFLKLFLSSISLGSNYRGEVCL
jgi:hypothetical protein